MPSGPKKPVGKAKDHTTKRGGARPGAGRPRLYKNSELIKQDLYDTCEEMAKKNGTTLAEEICAVAWGKDKQYKMPALRLIYEKLTMTTPTKEGNNNEKEPPVELPEMKADPARVIPLSK